jgi:hypothetical protein
MKGPNSKLSQGISRGKCHIVRPCPTISSPKLRHPQKIVVQRWNHVLWAWYPIEHSTLFRKESPTTEGECTLFGL